MYIKNKIPRVSQTNPLQKLSTATGGSSLVATRLKKNWLRNILLVSLVCSLLIVGSTWIITQVVNMVCGYGCWREIAVGLLSLVIIPPILVIAGSLLLKSWVIDNLFVACFIMLPAGVAVLVANYLSPAESLYPSSLTSDNSLMLWYFGLSLLVFFIFMTLDCLLYLLFSRVHIIIFIIISSVFAVSLYYFVPPLFSHYQEKKLDQQASQNLKKLSFQLYKPTYVIDGYHLYTSAPVVDNYLGVNHAYYKLQYLYGENDLGAPSPYSLEQVAVPASYSLPGDCGKSITGFINLPIHTQPCELIGRSSAGCDVYYDESDVSQNIVGYCKLHEVLITLNTDRVMARKYPLETDMIKVFDSLVPSSLNELMSMHRNTPL